MATIMQGETSHSNLDLNEVLLEQREKEGVIIGQSNSSFSNPLLCMLLKKV